MIDQHVSGQFDHAYRLWNLICLEHWHRTFIDPASPPTGPVQTLG
jgi:asparagine synthase (glutamine-hydrolysing)